MKKTKKRALLSSVAMLVVSAVVLSSATFAWFVAGDTATVTGISANVKSGSSVQVSATGNADTFTSTLTATELASLNNTESHFPPDLFAVSTGPNVSDSSFFTGTLSGDWSFTSSSLTPAGLYSTAVRFKVWVKSATKGTVTLASSSVSGGINGAVYVAIREGTGTPVIYAADSTTQGYSGITSQVIGTDNSTPKNYVMDFADISTGTIALVTPTTGGISAHELEFANDGDVKELTIWMWLEGQDQNCAGTISANAELALQFNAPV